MMILHTADIHLKEYEDDRWNTLKKIIKVGREKKIDVLAISGDLFDKGIDAEKLRPRIRDMFSDNGFTIAIIPGNHDSESFEAGMYFGDDAEVLGDISSPYEPGDGSVAIWGMPFEPIKGGKILDRLRSLKDNLDPDKKNILLYHGELLDAFFSRHDFGDEGDERYMPIKLSYLDGIDLDYVLAGHFHSHFDVRTLDSGGFFVYPGSPVSISKREVGRRKVNLFEVGQSPREYLLDTPHFEELTIEFDPFRDKDPLMVVQAASEEIHPQANVILTVGGFVNCKETEMDESTLVEGIRSIVGEKCVEEHFEFGDVQMILEDDLFRRFLDKLEKGDFEEEEKRRMREVAIRAMTGAKK